MPANDWHVLVAVAIGVVALFAIAIVLGLRFATRNQARLLRETGARDVLAAIRPGNLDRANLLYGVWQATMTQVILHVRDGNDHDVGSIVERAFGGSITAGDEQYTVVVTSGWRESAALVRAGDGAEASAPLCRFERRGWGGGSVGRYTLPDDTMISVRARWRFGWKPAPLPVIQDGRTIGQLFGIGRGMINAGRGVVLPPSIPLPVRLFILYKAAGARRASSTAH